MANQTAGLEISAVKVLSRAVNLDKEQKFPQALVCYQEGIHLLMEVLPDVEGDELFGNISDGSKGVSKGVGVTEVLDCLPIGTESEFGGAPGMTANSSEDKRLKLRNRISEYMDRAEKVKVQVDKEKDSGKYHEEIQIENDATGYDYEKLFKRLLDDAVIFVQVEDPYIMSNHQIVIHSGYKIKPKEALAAFIVKITELNFTNHEDKPEDKHVKTFISSLSRLFSHPKTPKSGLVSADICKRWERYIDHLFEDEREELMENAECVTGPEITKSEITNAIKKMKKGKAIGPDEISTEMIQALGEYGTELLHKVYNFLRFCELLVKFCCNLKRISLLTGRADKSPDEEKQQSNRLFKIAKSLNSRGIELQIEFSKTLHDRVIKFSNGWILKIGRGLDIYKASENNYCIGYCDFSLRKCHQTTINIYHSKHTKQSS
ncbi:MIT domain-containing protein 1 [Nymphon striatum]|nr:MIT domain-containing protein 1 [Nymphon striatum]